MINLYIAINKMSKIMSSKNYKYISQETENKIAIFLFKYMGWVWFVGGLIGINLAFISGFWIVKLVSTPYKWLIDLIW